MKNSPTICQIVVAAAIEPTCNKFPQACIYHYMGDILLAAENTLILHEALQHLLLHLKTFGLQIAPKKVQRQEPWKYLDWNLFNQIVHPQKLTLATQIKTLHDAQKLLGSINWLRPRLGIATHELNNLFDILKGDADLNSQHLLTKEANYELQ